LKSCQLLGFGIKKYGPLKKIDVILTKKLITNT